ncbi:MAG: hypothetical protein JO336_11635 [Acidobacteriia bacterium]|nr:hypothetical protein [Terriglobia bacterium]MBV9744594.1 hypothetical protein [Terriglobia bacterium]
MKLADLRKLSIRQNLNIRFPLPNGLECVISEHGVAQIPALRRAPDFNLEQELASVAEFILEPAACSPPQKKPPEGYRRVGRAELDSLVAAPAAASNAAEDE